MKQIKIRKGSEVDSWIAVNLLDADSRPGWVQIQNGAEAQWTKLDDVHPADQVLLQVEGLAKRRYQFVPKEDMTE